MSPRRWFVLLVGLGVILGLMLWLVNSLHWLYIQVSFTTPLLANILLLLLIALLAGLVYAFFYYLFLFGKGGKKKRRSPHLRVPVEKTEAAEETLRAVRRQLSQIEDEVARQALLIRARELEDSFVRQEFRVVVFGTGSAGKTSLVNALLGEMVGEVGAPMGTTDVGETYSFWLGDMDQEILVTDTPGILEAGIAGTYREQMARQLAAEADLLLFVLDNDLRQSEYTPLVNLVDMGKRSLLVLNKIDLLPEEDQLALLKQLRWRVKGLIAAADVIGIAAHPQPLRLETGEWLDPQPHILPLIRRMAAVLRDEGDDLIADNILLQSQRLGDEARQIIDQQRRRQAEKVVERYQWIGAGVICVTPIPVVDLLATAAVNAQMVVEIGKVYGCELNRDRGRDLALSLGKTLASLGIVKGAVDLIAAALQLSLGGIVIGKAVQSISAAYLTRIAGKSFIEYFRHNQDWGDGGMTEVVQQQFQLNRRDEFIKAFVQEAIAKLPESLGKVIPAQLSRPLEDLREREEENWLP
ncbi:GTP-binding protein [Candidatus Synechococcus calcipolaris G9]|uniref:GTP-binding protein n=1 Tax=Candidatus Synechococcus calcipolaris G9 TaxID=1497997 RepID=A0ABT6EW95_9SYNE|nr:GTP-binding protein [Candidatus Synechococcus calcipolaris]MDG2990054.1 GTP-binding protein [Candidatus Synechococcus calcipolaris G9]